jgi:hypothetical protein
VILVAIVIPRYEDNKSDRRAYSSWRRYETGITSAIGGQNAVGRDAKLGISDFESAQVTLSILDEMNIAEERMRVQTHHEFICLSMSSCFFYVWRTTERS